MRRMEKSTKRNSAAQRMMDLALRWRRELRIVLRRLSSEVSAEVAAGGAGERGILFCFLYFVFVFVSFLLNMITMLILRVVS